MLFKALQYFWVKFWAFRARDHITRVSGETYWLYRLHVQVALTGLAVVVFIGTEFLPGAREMPMANHVVLACVFTLVAALELLRLRIQLREQREFDDLFYG
jgi:formate-dependent nitrite reductase membrane component NrfD